MAFNHNPNKFFDFLPALKRLRDSDVRPKGIAEFVRVLNLRLPPVKEIVVLALLQHARVNCDFFDNVTFMLFLFQHSLHITHDDLLLAILKS